MAAQGYRVLLIVAGNAADHEIVSPEFATREEAEADLSEIRGAQIESRFPNLGWLTTHSGHIRVGWVTESLPDATYASRLAA